MEFRPSEVAAAVALSVSGELHTVHFDNSPLFSLLQKVKTIHQTHESIFLIPNTHIYKAAFGSSISRKCQLWRSLNSLKMTHLCVYVCALTYSLHNMCNYISKK